MKRRQVKSPLTAKFIRHALSVSKMSKSQLADRVGMSRSQMTGRFKGAHGMTLTSVHEVADSLNCEVEIHLVPRAGGVPKPEAETTAARIRRERAEDHVRHC